MKTLKFIAVGMLLAISVMVFSEPIPAAKNSFEAKNNLLKNFKSNMYKWNVTGKIETGCSTELVIYCSVNEQNLVEIVRIDGEMESVKHEIISLMERHPIEGSSILQGKIVAFKLRLETK